MYQNIIQRITILTDRYGFKFQAFQHDTLFIVFAEQHLFAVAQENRTVGTKFLIDNLFMDTVVKDHTVHQHFSHGSTFMAGRSSQHFGRILQIHIDHTGKEITTGTQSQFSRNKRIFDRPVRRALGNETTIGSRGILPLRQTIYLVVEQHDIQVHVAADSMDKMVTTDSQTVAVTSNQPDAQVRTSRLHAGSDSSTTTMNRMETVCVHIIR